MTHWTQSDLDYYKKKELLRKDIILNNMEKPVKENKYRNKKTVVDGIPFDSAKEGRRYGQLKLLEKSREIMNLKLQVKFPLICNTLLVSCVPNGEPFKIKLPYNLIKEYIADFTYTTLKTGVNDLPEPEEYIVEDCKGYRTKEYKLKKRLMKLVYGIEIKEI